MREANESLSHIFKSGIMYYIVFVPQVSSSSSFTVDTKRVSEESYGTYVSEKVWASMKPQCLFPIIFMFVSIPQTQCFGFYGIFKKEAAWWFDKHANLKYKYRNQRKFWCRSYYVDTIGRNQKVIAEYIQNRKKTE